MREEDAMDCCGYGQAGVTRPWMGSMPPISVAAIDLIH
jgi:hypothetical protein